MGASKEKSQETRFPFASICQGDTLLNWKLEEFH
jgi:hypothetical protein